MKNEIGGYFEFETFEGELYHKDSIALNCGRNCLKCLVKIRNIKRIWIPDYMCNSVTNAFLSMGCEVMEYKINSFFLPQYNFNVTNEDWILLCDYFGQLDDKDIIESKAIFDNRVICDETQGFYRKLQKLKVDAIYSCRKWFGVTDGGFLSLKDDNNIPLNIERDKSKDRMLYLFGRFEENASKYYYISKKNDELFEESDIKGMSLITRNILKGINYDSVAYKRRENWDYLHNNLAIINRLSIKKPFVPFMYPLLIEESGLLRKELAKRGIYVPILWPNVIEDKRKKDTIAYKYSKDILPLPIDQRYSLSEMDYIIDVLKELL